ERFAELSEVIEKLEPVDAHDLNIVALDSPSHSSNVSLKQKERPCLKLFSLSPLRIVINLSKCFQSARISALLLDDGIVLDKNHDIEWHQSFLPTVGRVLRIECLAEEILDEGTQDGKAWTLANIVALKSIAAYCSGLEIDTHVAGKDGEDGLFELGSLYPYHKQELYRLCIYTKFSDKDLDSRLSNPLHLRSLLVDSRFSKCRIVLLHASYPFSEEASYLASVYLNFGLAVPNLSVHGMISSVKELLELAPIKKVMFSTDGYAFPETYYLVLRDACIEGDLSISEAAEAAKDIFSQNAKEFYKIDVTSSSCGTIKTESHNILERGSSASKGDIVYVVPSNRFNDVVSKSGVGLTYARMG
ncbi:Amidohydrolase-related, partial [Dillenia turbinata]